MLPKRGKYREGGAGEGEDERKVNEEEDTVRTGKGGNRERNEEKWQRVLLRIRI
jgi:hypothetical protein